MPRPGVGNPGNKGGGRKSAYQEKADAESLWKMFFGELDRTEVLAKIESGKYSLKDIFISKGFTGNERILVKIFDKLFPDEFKGELEGEFVLRWANEKDRKEK